MRPHLLVVEDDAAIRDLLDFTLVAAGYRVTALESAERAIEEIRMAVPTLALIDWMLPGLSGVKLVARLRADERTRELPLILVTAKDDEPSRVAGLDSGADDYVVKPFSPRELVARIRALVRRRVPELSDEPIVVGPIALDPGGHQVLLGGVAVPLRLAEFRILRFLMAYAGRVFSREELLNRVWGDHVFIEERTVDVHIRRLRIALDPHGRTMIETVRGGGYRLNLEAQKQKNLTPLGDEVPRGTPA